MLALADVSSKLREFPQPEGRMSNLPSSSGPLYRSPPSPRRQQLFCWGGFIISRPAAAGGDSVPFKLGRSKLERSRLGRCNTERLALLLLCLSLACVVPSLLAKKKDQTPEASPNEQRRAVQALNRLTFGPRPGDVQQVMAMGVDRWIDLQLHPDKISDSGDRGPAGAVSHAAHEFERDRRRISRQPDDPAGYGRQTADAVRSCEARGVSGADGAVGKRQKEARKEAENRKSAAGRRSGVSVDAARTPPRQPKNLRPRPAAAMRRERAADLADGARWRNAMSMDSTSMIRDSIQT